MWKDWREKKLFPWGCGFGEGLGFLRTTCPLIPCLACADWSHAWAVPLQADLGRASEMSVTGWLDLSLPSSTLKKGVGPESHRLLQDRHSAAWGLHGPPVTGDNVQVPICLAGARGEQAAPKHALEGPTAPPRPVEEGSRAQHGRSLTQWNFSQCSPARPPWPGGTCPPWRSLTVLWGRLPRKHTKSQICPNRRVFI